jgi:hypothetical protein
MLTEPNVLGEPTYSGRTMEAENREQSTYRIRVLVKKDDPEGDIYSCCGT